MSVLPKNILVIDTRINLIELSAFAYAIRLEQEYYDNVLLGKFYFEHRIAIMMKEFIEYLVKINGCPEIRYHFDTEENEEILNMILSLIIQDFPVIKFAKNFQLKRVLEKGIKNMNVSVISIMDFKQKEFEKLMPWLDQPEPLCNLSVNSINPEYQITIRENMIQIPAPVLPL